ncbi:MAG: YraN family protein [Neptuniibacter sp.]
MDKKKIGMDAERKAETFLRKERLKLITRNFRSRFGEIDLIMMDSNTLVFIEVRLRNSRKYGGAAASVTRQKQSRIIKTAQWFLMQNNQFQSKACRFDVIAFEDEAAPDKPLWYKDAFSA